MTDASHHPCADLSHRLKHIQTTIQKHGLQILSIDGTDYSPAFSYSIGLFERFQHPEIICFGFTAKLSQILINDIAGYIQDHSALVPYQDYADVFFEGQRCQFIPVQNQNLADYFGTAIAYYHTDQFPALQLVWTDREDSYPWEEHFADEFLHRQPLLDRNAQFKFLEPKNLGVFTTKQWLKDQAPILTVIHDQDGDWQFLTADPIHEDDVVLVGLKHLVESDLSLNALFDLQYGECARRTTIHDEWVISDLSDD